MALRIWGSRQGMIFSVDFPNEPFVIGNSRRPYRAGRHSEKIEKRDSGVLPTNSSDRRMQEFVTSFLAGAKRRTREVGQVTKTFAKQVGVDHSSKEADVYTDALEHLRWFALTDRGFDLLDRYKSGGASEESALQDAIECLKNAVVMSSKGVGDAAYSSVGLATALITRYGQTGALADVDEAIVQYMRALEVGPSDPRDKANYLNNYANALTRRFQQSGDLTDLDKAILSHKEALELRPPGHPERSDSLNNLACALEARFGKAGTRADLDQAITCLQSALEIQGLAHADCSMTLNNLANVLMSRFLLVEDQVDLDGAIMDYKMALALRPPGHPGRTACLSNLGGALSTRSDLTGDHADLDLSIACYQSASTVGPLQPDFSAHLNNYANALKTRFYQRGDFVDLDKAINCHRLALAPSRDPNQPARPAYLGSYSNTLVTRFNQSGCLADLDEAIAIYRSILKLISPGHRERSTYLYNLAYALRARHCKTSIDDHRLALDDPKHVFSSSFTASSSPPDSMSSLRNLQIEILNLLKEATLARVGGPCVFSLQASLLWVDVAVEWGDPSAIEAYSVALGLVEVLLTTGSSLESRHMRLASSEIRRTRTLAVDGAACALSSGEIELAVEMLDQGRSVLLTQAGKYRTRVDDLEAIRPDLAKLFKMICTKMEASAMGLEYPKIMQSSLLTTQDTVADYQQLLETWTNLVDVIRSLHGFESFLQPTPFITLQAAAADGPVIILNFSRMHSDAIIVQSYKTPLVVHLEHATPDLMVQLAERAHATTADSELKKLLGTLWRTVVQPIVRRLIEDLHLKPHSRIWWCPTSAASHLPIHAAGDYTKRGQNLPDLFVSSYTATLSALVRARTTRLTEPSTIPKILIIGQSQNATLPTVGAEIATIKSIAKDLTVLDAEDATPESTLEAMRYHSWMHLACHGHLDEEHPFQSHFSLHGGPLTLLEITRQTLPDAQLAFLSSCHSAEGNRERPDEVLHLASGVQFAGFRSVVGTLWAMDGLDGPNVAEIFDSDMLGSKRKAKSSPALALHRAVTKLRQSRISSTRWACFVHYGT